MKKLLAILILAAAAVAAQAEIRSYTIEFGAENSSTQPLDNTDFTESVVKGRGYIADVTSVVNVFPEKDCIKMGSSKNNGKFNIHLAREASIIPEYYIIKARRYDNNRDAEAMITFNSENVYITETTVEEYRIDNNSIAPKAVTNLIVDADKRLYIYSISVYYDTANGVVEPEKEQVKMPQFTPAGGNVTEGSTVTITCTTEDAEIHYTTDGSTPTAVSTLYTLPLTVERPMTVKAIAVHDGMIDSDIAEATFTVSDASTTATAYFNFNEPGSLHPAVAEPEQSQWVDLNGRSFTDSDVAISFEAVETGNTHVRLYHSYDAGCDVRLYDGESMTIASMLPNMLISRIVFEASDSGTSTVQFDADCGEFDIWDYEWRPLEGERVSQVRLTSEMQSRMKTVTVYLTGAAGIPDLDYNRDENATYYNINGVRIDAGTQAPGFYIRVTPSSATKVVVK